MKIVFTPEALAYFNELSTLLYEKNYFGFEESALEYVDDLLKDIKETLPNRVKRPAPPYFDRYGKKMVYCTFRKNKDTHWYVFFNLYQNGHELWAVVRYIGNNHLIAPYL
ncbi:MAG: hypothetical protein LIP00_13550 [Parabacteroides sp.]|nr:hypothetical protein [Parabacteroides sp.]